MMIDVYARSHTRALTQNLMDLALSYGSSLPQIWAVEALACSKDVEPSLLLDLLRETPNISNNIGKNARELVSLKILERLFIQGGLANPESSALSKTVRLDSSDHCEDVLRRILNEGPAETEISKWDLEPFIEHKRSTLPRCALEQLKDAIISGSLSISTTLREKSGLLSHADHQVPAKDGSSNGITPRVEESDINDGNLLPTDLSDEGERCGVETNEYTSSGLGVPSEVLPCGKQVLLHGDTEVNKKSEKQQRQDRNIAAPDFRKTNEDVNRFEPYSKNADEVEENVHVADDNDGNGDGMTDISRKEDAPFSPWFTNNRNSSETLNSRDQIVLPDTSKRYSEGRCRVEEETCPEGMSQHCDVEGLNVNIDVVMHDRKGENKEIGRKGCQAKLTNDDIDKFDQNVPSTIRTVDEAEEDDDISSYSDGYHDERASRNYLRLKLQATEEVEKLLPEIAAHQDLMDIAILQRHHMLIRFSKWPILVSIVKFKSAEILAEEEERLRREIGYGVPADVPNSKTLRAAMLYLLSQKEGGIVSPAGDDKKDDGDDDDEDKDCGEAGNAGSRMISSPKEAVKEQTAEGTQQSGSPSKSSKSKSKSEEKKKRKRKHKKERTLSSSSLKTRLDELTKTRDGKFEAVQKEVKALQQAPPQMQAVIQSTAEGMTEMVADALSAITKIMSDFKAELETIRKESDAAWRRSVTP